MPPISVTPILAGFRSTIWRTIYSSKKYFLETPDNFKAVRSPFGTYVVMTCLGFRVMYSECHIERKHERSRWSSGVGLQNWPHGHAAQFQLEVKPRVEEEAMHSSKIILAMTSMAMLPVEGRKEAVQKTTELVGG